MRAETPNSLPGPRGLGGLLWIFGLPLATLPLFIFAMTADSLVRLPSKWSSTGDSSLAIASSIEMAILFLIVSLTFFAAEYFFRKSSRFPSLWLMLMASILFHNVAMDIIGAAFHRQMMLPIGDAMHIAARSFADTWPFLLFTTLSMLYLKRSRRARNTFSAHIIYADSSRSTMVATLFEGPRDWQRVFWMLGGYMVLALFLHSTSIIEMSRGAFETVIAPTMNASSVALTVDNREWIFIARVRLGIHIVGLMLSMLTIFWFVRRMRAFRWGCATLLLLAIASPMVHVMIDPPVFMLDGPDQPQEARIASMIACIAMPYLIFSSRMRNFSRRLGDKIAA